MRPLEASVSTQTGLTLSSGRFVLARVYLTFSALKFQTFYLYSTVHSVSLSINSLPFNCFLKWVVFLICRRVRSGNGCKVGDDNGSL
jgi:hypothetical protein